jgi:hypothetical protein
VASLTASPVKGGGFAVLAVSSSSAVITAGFSRMLKTAKGSSGLAWSAWPITGRSSDTTRY